MRRHGRADAGEVRAIVHVEGLRQLHDRPIAMRREHRLAKRLGLGPEVAERPATQQQHGPRGQGLLEQRRSPREAIGGVGRRRPAQCAERRQRAEPDRVVAHVVVFGVPQQGVGTAWRKRAGQRSYSRSQKSRTTGFDTRCIAARRKSRSSKRRSASARLGCGWSSSARSVLRRMCSSRGPQKSAQIFFIASSIPEAARWRLSGGTPAIGLNPEGRARSGASK